MKSLILTLSSLVALTQFYLVSIGASAEPTSNATCFESYSKWMNNEEGQSPCLVAAYLLSPCSSTALGAFIPALNGSRSLYNFAGTTLDSTPCVCSTVTFSMLYACATCQGAELAILPWYIVSENCTSGFTTTQYYPEKISPNTSVPFWAYLDVMSTGRLDISVAKQVALEHEPDATASGFYGASSPTPSYGNGYSPGGWEGDQFVDDSQGVGIGVIVGAVVGGSVGLITIATALGFLLRASRRRRRAMAEADRTSSPRKERFDDRALGSAAKLYNPDDPTTYPSIFLSPAAPTGEKSAIQPNLGRAGATQRDSTQVAHSAKTDPTYPGRPEV